MSHSPSQRARTAGQRLAIDVATARVVEAMRAAGVDAILFKGPALDRLYEDSMRSYGDADLLVASSHAARAEAVLAELGFERYKGEPDVPGVSWRAHPWIDSRGGVAIDLHRYLVGARAEPERVWTALSSRTHALPLAGSEVDVPNDDALAVVVSLHAAQHGPRWIRPQSDLERALDVLPESTWAAAARLADEIDAADAFAAGLRLLPAGAELASRLGLTAAMTTEVALALEEDAGMALSIEQLANVEGIWNKAKTLAREVFPTPTFMHVWLPGTATSRWRLIGAYVRRPFYLLRRLPHSVRLWRRARKGDGAR